MLPINILDLPVLFVPWILTFRLKFPTTAAAGIVPECAFVSADESVTCVAESTDKIVLVSYCEDGVVRAVHGNASVSPAAHPDVDAT